VLFGIRETIDLSKDWSEERKTSFQQLPDNHKSVDIYVKGITDNIKEVVESSKKHLEIEKVATEAPLIDSGTFIMIKRYPEPQKMQFPWEGPYKIVEKTSDVEYCIESLLGARRYIHVDDIKVLGKDIDLDKAMN
ncbi:hypothetical protein ADUPG1_005123, partial [Aduncisulcus paluster]